MIYNVRLYDDDLFIESFQVDALPRIGELITFEDKIVPKRCASYRVHDIDHKLVKWYEDSNDLTSDCISISSVSIYARKE